MTRDSAWPSKLFDLYTQDGAFLSALHYHRVDEGELDSLLGFIDEFEIPEESIGVESAYLIFDLAPYICRSANLMRSGQERAQVRRLGAMVVSRLQTVIGEPWSAFDFHAMADVPAVSAEPAFWGYRLDGPGRDIEGIRRVCPSVDLVDREFHAGGYLAMLVEGLHDPAKGDRFLGALRAFVTAVPHDWPVGRSLADALVDHLVFSSDAVQGEARVGLRGVVTAAKRLVNALPPTPAELPRHLLEPNDVTSALAIIADNIRAPEGYFPRLARGEADIDQLARVVDALRVLVAGLPEWDREVFRHVWNVQGVLAWSELCLPPESRYFAVAATREIESVVPAVP